MRLSLYSVVVSLVAGAAATAEIIVSKTTVELPATFTPPAVFKNSNLVRIFSLEKNFAHETLNIQVENIDKEEQTEYFLSFDASEFPRVGGLEVKNKRDSEYGDFIISPVAYDASSPVQYYQITFPTPLASGEQLILGITYNLLEAFRPLPASIGQDDRQYLKFDFSAHFQSPYKTVKQKTDIKFPSSSIADYTKIDGLTNVAGHKLSYGPFSTKEPNSVYPASVRYDFTKPVLHVKTLDRDVEVSHWGGNVAFEENYELYHRGANLSTLFNRVKWAQSQYMGTNTYALSQFVFNLPVGAQDPYYTDVIGNVSTSHYRANTREARLEAKPRYPIFGGWKYPFTIGWNSDASDFVRNAGGNNYVLSIPAFDGPRQAEGVEYSEVNIQILLPEGADNVRFYTTLPQSSIVETTVTKIRTYLDTVGRTAVIVKAENLVDEMHDRQIFVSYDYSTAAALRKPLTIFASTFGTIVAVYLLTSIDLSFARSSKKTN